MAVRRVAAFPTSSSATLLRHLHHDLLAHTGGQISDDAAVLAIERTASHHPHRPGITAHSPVTVTGAADRGRSSTAVRRQL